MSRSFAFGTRWIGRGHPTLIIAEVGINHEGDPDTCMRLIEAAGRAGADAIKLITVKARENYAPETESFAIFSKAELPNDATAKAFDLARHLGMECFSTCGDVESFEFVKTLKPAGWKISSGLLTHSPLIERAARTGLPLLMSTGMSGLEDVGRSVDVARNSGAVDIAVFQCTSLYPTPPQHLNLRAIQKLSDTFDVPAGFSDHSAGFTAAALAVAAGACMIEKHFSLDPCRAGFDHKVSLDPKDFASMVSSIREAEVMLGSSAKEMIPEVKPVANLNLRSIVARRDIPLGKKLDAEDLAVVRTAGGTRGLPPEALAATIGRTSAKDLRAFEPLNADDLQ